MSTICSGHIHTLQQNAVDVSVHHYLLSMDISKLSLDMSILTRPHLLDTSTIQGSFKADTSNLNGCIHHNFSSIMDMSSSSPPTWMHPTVPDVSIFHVCCLCTWSMSIFRDYYLFADTRCDPPDIIGLCGYPGASRNIFS